MLKTKFLANLTDWRRVSWLDIYRVFGDKVSSSAISAGFFRRFLDSTSFGYDVGIFSKIPDGAKNALVVISGTHGVEGPAGSFVQARMLQDTFFAEQKDTAIIFIHGLNPYGYMHGRRTNEHNVDINRNAGTEFVTKSDYAAIHPLIAPKVWDDAAVKNLQDGIHSNAGAKDALMGGQYDFPDGIFFGGKSPERSVLLLEHFCKRYLSVFTRVSILDIHTGLGEFGKLTAISPADSADNPLAVRTKHYCGDTTVFPNLPKPGSLISPASGSVIEAAIRWLPNTEVTPIALEFGTYPIAETFPWFVAENWLYHHRGVLPLEKQREIKEKFWDIFYPIENRVSWLEAIKEQSFEVAQKVILGMKKQ